MARYVRGPSEAGAVDRDLRTGGPRLHFETSQSGLPRWRPLPDRLYGGRPAAGPAKDDVEQNDKRDLYNGFGDGLARAFEFAVTPAIFGVLGYLPRPGLGTVPVFTIVLALLCVVGMFLKTWYVYDADA